MHFLMHVLVKRFVRNEKDQYFTSIIGNGNFCEKMEAHEKGLMHYAFSVFVFNEKKELLIQKRANEKYHSGGLWSNTCCGHPLTSVITEIQRAAENRLMEEMGLMCSIMYVGKIKYQLQCGQLVENEIDHIFIGFSNNTPQINISEVEDYRWINKCSLMSELQHNGNSFTEWFKVIINSNLLNKYFIW